MAINEYDSILAKSDPAQNSNPYDTMLSNEQGEKKQAVQNAMSVAVQKQPDQQAKILELSKKTNLPPDFVERNFDDLSKKHEIAKNDYDSLIEKSPALSGWLQDPNNAAVARDDIPGLQGVEQQVQNHSMLSDMYSALNSGLAQLYSSAARVPALMYDTAALPQNLVVKAFGHPELQVKAPDWLANNPVAKYYDEQAKAFQTPDMQKSVTEEIGKGNFKQAGMSLAAQFVANAPNQAALILAGVTGLELPALLAAGATTAAPKAQEARDKNFDPATGTVNALTHGTFEAAFEHLGTFGILHKWENVIANSYGKQASKEVFKDFAKTLVSSMAGEGNEEFWTSIAQDLSDHITGVNPDAIHGIGTRALDAGLVGAASGGLMTGPGAAVAGVSRVKQAQLNRDFYLSLGKSAEATKLRERLPDAQRALVEQITKGTGVENIYLSPEAIETYAQSAKINPVKMMQDIGASEAYNEAKETGADVKIPLSTWIDKAVGSEHYDALANDVKFNPQDLSVNEHQREAEQVKAQMEAAAKEAETKAQADQKFDDSKLSQIQAESVKNTVIEQLKSAGVDPKTADNYAKIYESAFKTLGERAGVNPLELFSRYGVQIRGQDQIAASNENAPLSLQQSVAAMQPVNTEEATRPIDTGMVLDQSEKPQAPAFYSRLQQTVEQKMGGSASVDQINGMLREIKPEERKWSGLDEFLKGKQKVSKEELLAYLRGNQIQIQEVTKSEDTAPKAEGYDILKNGQLQGVKSDRAEAEREVAHMRETRPGETWEVRARAYTANTEAAPKFSQYTLPGGENYREVLFTLPPKGPAADNEAQLAKLTAIKEEGDRLMKASSEKIVALKQALKASKKYQGEPNSITTAVYASSDVRRTGERTEQQEQALAELRESMPTKKLKTLLDEAAEAYRLMTTKTREAFRAGEQIRELHEGKQLGTYHSSHWDEPNVLAHVRLNDRTDADGKRVLMVEEIQSDWHQEGRKKGYKGDQAKLDVRPSDAGFGIYAGDERIGYFNSEAEAQAAAALPHYQEEAAKLSPKAVPDAPFRKTWHEFALKKILRMATEQGYDRVAWTTGEQQAERYDLSKQVNRISVRALKDGTFDLTAHTEEGKHDLGKGIQADKLDEMIGKDLAAKVLADSKERLTKDKTGGVRMNYEGQDLKVGGEGMKGFYDKMIPDFLNKFGKKFGAKVGETRLELNEASAPADMEFPTATKVHSIDITDKMKESILNEGFSLFQPGGAEGPRGQIRIGKQGINIDLLKTADLSTFLHETGHFYLEVLGDLASSETAPPEIKSDYQTVLDYLGVKDRASIQKEQHEKWARSFEAYLMEGKAPTSALKEAFAKFKLWLISVYKQISSLNVELTPEVRGVMDRILATDEELKAVEAAHETPPLFSDPKAQGMTDSQAERYISARQEARQAALEQAQAKVMREYGRMKEAWYKEKRAEIRTQVESEINQENVYKAISIMKDGTLPDGSPLPHGTPPVKLSKSDLTREFGKEILKRLPRGVTSKDGIHPSIAAEFLGFESADSLIQQMANAPDRKAAIESRTDQQMSGLYPEMIKDGRIQEEALKALHNEKRAQLLRMELEHLASNNMPVLKDVIRKVARRVPTEKMVRDQAARIIGSKNVQELSPSLYQRAEVRAAKEAGQLLAKGDIDAAFEAKRRELLNHELYRAAVEAQDSIEAALEKFKNLTKSDEDLAKTRDIDLVNAARAILAGVGIGKSEKPASAYLEQMKRYDPDAYETVSALIESVSHLDLHHSQLKYDDFVALRDTVDALWDLAKTTRQMVIDGKSRDIAEVKAELSTRLSELIKPGNKGQYDRGSSQWEKTKLNLLGIKASLRRVESWVSAVDGMEDIGPFRRYLFTPIKEAIDQYRSVKKGYIERYRDLVKAVAPSLSTKEIIAHELVGSDGRTMVFKGKAELLGALLHSGNESNLSKLLRGYGWGSVDQSGILDTSRWDAFIKRMWQESVLTKADHDFVQSVWNLHEEMKSGAQKAHKEMYGFYFNEITAKEFQTPYGTYKGGYAPAVVDHIRNQDAALRADREALEKNGNSYMFPTTGRGFSKSRVDQYAAPLSLDLGLVPAHIDKVLRFTHVEPKVKAAGRLVMDKEFRKSLNALDPAIATDMLVPWLQRSAQQKIEMPSQGYGGKGMDRFFKTVRSRSGLQTMTFNAINTVQNLAGFSLAMLKVGPKHLRNGLWEFIHRPGGLSSDIADKSTFMKNSMEESAAEIQKNAEDIIASPSATESVRDHAVKVGYFLQKQVQGTMDIIVWHGAYEQAIENGHGEVDAVRLADSAVRETQGSFHAEDISRAETGTPFMRLFTMFYSYFNMQANLLGTEFTKVVQDVGLKRGSGRLLYVYTLGLMMPAVISELIAKGMSGDLGNGDDDEEYLTEALSIFFESQGKTLTAMVPGGKIAEFAAKKIGSSFSDEPSRPGFDDKLSMSPALNALESGVGALKSVPDAVFGDGNKKKAVKDSLTLLGLLTGLPLGPLSKPLNYATDVNEGNANPTGPVDLTRGFLTGKAGKQ
jgi:hypothetical protein